jgi:hypothetical protein
LEFENTRLSYIETDDYETQVNKRRLERIIGPLWAHSLPRD